MGYYGSPRGDYYRGDYYRGDPGLFSGIASFAKKAIGTVVAATPAGRIIEAVRPGTIPTFGGAGRAIAPTQFPTTGPGPGVAVVPSPLGPIPPLAMTSPQGQTVLGTMSAGGRKCELKGTHTNRSGYFRRTPGGSVIFVEKGSVCVPNRRMNPGNARALRRALSRAYAFKNLAMRTLKLVAPRERKTFAGFKRRKRRA